jgi:membrane-associated phospholipid phosphatase
VPAARLPSSSLSARSRLPEALGLFAFLGFLLLTACLGSVEWQDTYVASVLDALRGDQPYAVTTIWLTRAAPFFAAALVVIGAVVALRRGTAIADVCWVLMLLAVGLLLVEGVKLFIDRERPGGLLQHPTASGCFPSGHVANAALCVAAALALLHRVRSRRDVVRAAIMGAGSLFVIAVAFTRIYLRLHWLSDVLASMLFGLSFGGMLSARPRVQRGLLAALVLLVLPLLYVAVAYGLRVTIPSPGTSADSLRPDRAPGVASYRLR